MARFNDRLARYREELSEWNSLSAFEKIERGHSAERGMLVFWTLVPIVGMTFCAYYIFNKRFHGDDVWIYSGLFFVFSCVILLPFSWFFGKLVRGSLIGAAVGAITYYIITKIQEGSSNPPSDHLKTLASYLIGGFAFCLEWLGVYKNTGRPLRPMGDN